MPPKRTSFAVVVPLVPSPEDMPRRADNDDATGEDLPPFGEGRFQQLVAASSVLAAVTFLLHSANFRVVTREADHWCRQPDQFGNLSESQWQALAIPLEPDGTRSQCSVRQPPDGGSTAPVVSCDEWDFDHARLGSNVVSEWSLVCHRRWLILVAVIFYTVIGAVGVSLAGLGADRVGRRVVMKISLVMLLAALVALLIAGFTANAANWLPLLILLRTIVSVTANCLMIVLAVVLYEVTTPSRRLLYCYITPATSFTAASIITILMAHFKVSWDGVHMVLMVPISLLITTFTIVDESPAWLIASCKFLEAEHVAMRVARFNHVAAEDCHDWFNRAVDRNDRLNSMAGNNRSYVPTFTSDFRKRSLLLCYVWAATAFSSNQLYLNSMFPFLKPMMVGTVVLCQLPVLAAVYALIVVFSAKRTVVVSSMMLSSLTLILAALYDRDLTLLKSLLVVTIRILANLCVILLFFVTMQNYASTMRCTGLVIAYAVGHTCESLGEILFYFVPRHRRDIILAAIAILMACSPVALEYLPQNADRPHEPHRESMQSAPLRRYSIVIPDDVRRSMQESLVSLPKGPQRNMLERGARRKVSLPEQYSVRISRASLGYK
ncbi:hypothetical protein HPB49_011860 [Dermacentor silvarum]|uniref:Uncharacterized protein n=1 Tax=Dermacentor silvarum TaxID=543639 RepID=A0ACB8E0P5_DERSI|nr:solute carrier family 22 member 7 [Dermacentor silvarum]KAH7979904.1 hypothetical protein HPB49_011860 [Dermacentor silvarum]